MPSFKKIILLTIQFNLLNLNLHYFSCLDFLNVNARVNTAYFQFDFKRSGSRSVSLP